MANLLKLLGLAAIVASSLNLTGCATTGRVCEERSVCRSCTATYEPAPIAGYTIYPSLGFYNPHRDFNLSNP